MAQVNTVLGPVDGERLGRTLVHEHISIATPGIAENWPDRFDRAAAVTSAVARLQAAEERGVGTIIDLTTADMGRNVPLMQEVARQTGVNVVVATGIYWMVPRYWHDREADDLAQAIVHEITEGIAGTGVYPGAIKLATDTEGVTPVNEKCLRAGARAHRQTGIPILTHNGPPTMSRDQQRILLDEGVSMENNVVIGHVGDTEDTGLLKELMDHGAFVGMDRFGLDLILDFEARVGTIAKLCADGYADRITLSHDSCCAIDWIADYKTMVGAVPNWNMVHISDDVLPALRERGVSEAQIETMFVDNPRRLLEPAAPY